MYHCHIHFYFAGRTRSVLETIQSMPPLDAFSHTFSESVQPDPALAGRADVILADLTGTDPGQVLQALAAAKGEHAQLIALAGREQLGGLSGTLEVLTDLWPMPMSEEELRFRFLRWQQTCKLSKDFLQTSHYLDATINSVPNLVWYKTKDGVHEKVNDSFCQTVNKTKEQVQGQRHAYIWDVEQDDPACIQSEQEVMTTRKTCVAEEAVVTGDGTRLLTTYKSPLYDLDGSVMGTVGVAIDVTRERAYEQALIQKNRTLETIFTTMDCGVITTSLEDSRILSLNRAALRITGYDSQEELIGDGFCLFSPSVVVEDRQYLLDQFRTLKKEGDSVSLEYRVQHKNGDILHLMGNAKLIRENGELVCQRFFLDCTAQKLAEEREREEDKRRQMALVQALSVDYNLVFFYDLDTEDGELLQLQDAGAEWFSPAFTSDRPVRACFEHYIQTVVHEDDRAQLATAWNTLGTELAQKKLLHVSYRAKVGGEIRYFQMKAVRAGAWEKRRGVVLGLCDIDDEFRSDMEQKRLLEDALLQANQANKAKSVFLSNMSHDIRTPMNAIVGFTALAITHINSKDQVAEYLKKIQTSGNHLLSLINDILDMSRIESGKMQLEEKPCSLPDILHGLRSILQADVRAKQLELQMDTVDVLNEDVYCDQLRLNQVLLNLLGNAVKFTPPGGVVSLRLTETPDAPDGYANYIFCVKDTGIGMSPEFVAHIFEPFSRERTSTVSGIQGTGLGMSITKNIVDMMNGSIEVKSVEGEGSEFTVRLTLQLYSDPKGSQAIPALQGLRALVVDDDFNCCDSVSYMLQQIGMRAEWTLSGKEAVLRTRQASMRKDNYSLYIVDWLLPDMNGVEVTRRIRRVAGKQVPIVVLSSYDWADIEAEATQAGVTAFCSKPLFFSELRKCLLSVTATAETGKAGTGRKLGQHGTGRILLAEDNELNQEIAVTILSEAGFTVDVADNGQIAVDMLKQAGADYYQLVLMDVRMPVMSGYEATRAIRALEDKALAATPIIAMTANAFEEDRQEALREGMNGHIAKPIDIKILFDTLEQILS